MFEAILHIEVTNHQSNVMTISTITCSNKKMITIQRSVKDWTKMVMHDTNMIGAPYCESGPYQSRHNFVGNFG